MKWNAVALLHFEPVFLGEDLRLHEERQGEEKVARAPLTRSDAVGSLVLDQRVVDAILELLHTLSVLYVHVCNKQHIGEGLEYLNISLFQKHKMLLCVLNCLTLHSYENRDNYQIYSEHFSILYAYRQIFNFGFIATTNIILFFKL